MDVTQHAIRRANLVNQIPNSLALLSIPASRVKNGRVSNTTESNWFVHESILTSQPLTLTEFHKYKFWRIQICQKHFLTCFDMTTH